MGRAGVMEKSRARAMLARYAADTQVDAALAALAAYWNGLAGALFAALRRRKAGPYGQYLAPVPVHGDVQYEPQRQLL